MENVTKHERNIAEIIQYGYQVMNEIDEKTYNVEAVQRTILKNLMLHNAGTRFGEDHDFKNIGSFEEYCQRIPFSDWDDYRDYVDRLLRDGEEGVLFSDELFWYANTSGTTGRNKFIPLNRTSVRCFTDDYVFRGLALADMECVKKNGTHLTDGKMLVVFGGIEYRTKEQNQPYGTIIAASIKLAKEALESISVIPADLLLQDINGMGITYYMYLRYGLMEKDVVYMISIYDRYLTGLFSCLRVYWQQLCDDIEKGIIGEWTGIPLEKRMHYQTNFHPEPERAHELREILQDGFDESTIQKIWPKLLLVSAAQKVDVLEDAVSLKSILGEIAYDNSPYGASECLMAVRMRIEEELTLIPDACIYEFIPEGMIADQETQTKKLWELEVGRRYEIVLTTYSGLYRYRIKDILEVVGKKGECPMVRFQARQGIIINLLEEKTTETALRNSITVAASLKRIPLSGYSVYGEMETLENGAEQGCYVVQYETKKTLTEQDKDLLAKEIDRQLCNMNESYHKARQNKKLKSLRVEEVVTGTYQRYDEAKRKKDGTDIQYKRPLKLKV